MIVGLHHVIFSGKAKDFHGRSNDRAGPDIVQREKYPLAERLKVLLLLPLANPEGVVPDPLARDHADRATIAHRLGSKYKAWLWGLAQFVRLTGRN